jgi:hypothetical protein
VSPSARERRQRMGRVGLGLFVLVISLIGLSREPDGQYPLGDVRNEPLFWLVFFGLLILGSVLMMLSAFFKHVRTPWW